MAAASRHGCHGRWRDVPLYLEEIGKCVAREVVSIEPQVSGRITAIHFVDGADVKTGDRLFTIDPRPYQAQLDLAEGDLVQHRAVLSYAKIEFALAQQLLPKNAIAKSDHDQMRNAVEIGEGKVKSGRGGRGNGEAQSGLLRDSLSH